MFDQVRVTSETMKFTPAISLWFGIPGRLCWLHNLLLVDDKHDQFSPVFVGNPISIKTTPTDPWNIPQASTTCLFPSYLYFGVPGICWNFLRPLGPLVNLPIPPAPHGFCCSLGGSFLTLYTNSEILDYTPPWKLRGNPKMTSLNQKGKIRKKTHLPNSKPPL